MVAATLDVDVVVAVVGAAVLVVRFVVAVVEVVAVAADVVVDGLAVDALETDAAQRKPLAMEQLVWVVQHPPAKYAMPLAREEGERLPATNALPSSPPPKPGCKSPP